MYVNKRIRKDGLESITRKISKFDIENGREILLKGYWGSKDGWYGGFYRNRFKTVLNLKGNNSLLSATLDLSFMTISGTVKDLDLSKVRFFDTRLSNITFDNCNLMNIHIDETTFYKCKIVINDLVINYDEIVKSKEPINVGDSIITTHECFIPDFVELKNGINKPTRYAFQIGTVVGVYTTSTAVDYYRIAFDNRENYLVYSGDVKKIERNDINGTK